MSEHGSNSFVGVEISTERGGRKRECLQNVVKYIR